MSFPQYPRRITGGTATDPPSDVNFPKFMKIPVLHNPMKRITAVVKGRVQGVGYRYFIAGCAKATGVHGYVKNLPDGTVELVAESSPASLQDFLRLARARDDPVIHVEEIKVENGPATGEFRGFGVSW